MLAPEASYNGPIGVTSGRARQGKAHGCVCRMPENGVGGLAPGGAQVISGLLCLFNPLALTPTLTLILIIPEASVLGARRTSTPLQPGLLQPRCTTTTATCSRLNRLNSKSSGVHGPVPDSSQQPRKQRRAGSWLCSRYLHCELGLGCCLPTKEKRRDRPFLQEVEVK